MNIVKAYADLYTAKFMEGTLYQSGGTAVKYPAFTDELTEFRGFWIIVDFTGPKHSRVWASNNVVPRPDNTKQAVIFVHPELAREPPHIRKVVLAHEWLEVMVVFRDRTRLRKKIIADKLDIVKLTADLGRPCPWQDTADEVSRYNRALRSLLLPKDKIEDLLHKRFQIPVSAFRQMASSSTNHSHARMIYERLLKQVAADFDVGLEIAASRLDEILFDFTLPEDET